MGWSDVISVVDPIALVFLPNANKEETNIAKVFIDNLSSFILLLHTGHSLSYINNNIVDRFQDQ